MGWTGPRGARGDPDPFTRAAIASHHRRQLAWVFTVSLLGGAAVLLFVVL